MSEKPLSPLRRVEPAGNLGRCTRAGGLQHSPIERALLPSCVLWQWQCQAQRDVPAANCALQSCGAAWLRGTSTLSS